MFNKSKLYLAISTNEKLRDENKKLRLENADLQFELQEKTKPQCRLVCHAVDGTFYKTDLFAPTVSYYGNCTSQERAEKAMLEANTNGLLCEYHKFIPSHRIAVIQLDYVSKT